MLWVCRERVQSESRQPISSWNVVLHRGGRFIAVLLLRISEWHVVRIPLSAQGTVPSCSWLSGWQMVVRVYIPSECERRQAKYDVGVLHHRLNGATGARDLVMGPFSRPHLSRAMRDLGLYFFHAREFPWETRQASTG